MGTTIGAISRLISRPLNGNDVRARPTAASVPRLVATSVAAGAMRKLFFAARAHSAEPNRFWYHLVENAGIGYTRKELSLNDSGTITRMGRSRKPSVATQNARSAHHPALSSGVAYAGNAGARRARNFIASSQAQLGLRDPAVDRVQHQRGGQQQRAERAGHAPVDVDVGVLR